MNEIFERPSASRWRFRIRRFSSMFLTGTTRLDVAVGTASDASMLRAIVAAPPAMGTASSPARARGGAGRGPAGFGADAGAEAGGGPRAAGSASASAASGAIARAGTDMLNGTRSSRAWNARRQPSSTRAGSSR